MAHAEPVTVWQADRRYRIGAYIVIAVLLVLSARVLIAYGYLALIGVALVLAAIGQTWWSLLRPKLTAGPDGVVVVNGRTPLYLPWQEIRRVEAGKEGLTIICAGGRSVVSRFPQQRPAPAQQLTEADAAAAYLAQRAAWERKPSGAAPVYQPPPRK